MGSCLLSVNKHQTDDNEHTQLITTLPDYQSNDVTECNAKTDIYPTTKSKLLLIGCNWFDELNVDLNKYQDEINNITDICSGCHFTIYCNHDDQKYYVSGSNADGQCGIGEIYKTVPVKRGDSTIMREVFVTSIKFREITFFQNNNIKIKKVLTNINSDCVFWITFNHEIYGNGRLDVVSNKSQFIPQLIEILHHVIDIKANYLFKVALCKLNMNALINGYSNYCVDNIPYDIIKLISKFYGWFPDTKIYATKWNNESISWRHITRFDDKNIIKIDCTSNGFYLLQKNGKLIYWGNCEKTTYIPPSVQYFNDNNIKIIDFSCGALHTVLVDNQYNVYYVEGKRFKPKKIEILKHDKIIKIKCGSEHSYVMSDDDKHFLWGDNNRNQCICNGMLTIPAPKCLDIKSNKIKQISLGNGNTKIIFEEPIKLNDILDIL